MALQTLALCDGCHYPLSPFGPARRCKQDMGVRFLRWNAGLIALVFSCSVTMAHAETWEEKGEAGSLIDSAQETRGSGALLAIDGTISNRNDADVYRIYLTGGETFLASTHSNYGGSADFDTMLFLFDEHGFGIYSNDDVDEDGLSRLPSNYPLTPKVPGFYYLVITSGGNDPVSSVGQIFPNPEDDTHVYPPSGPGGGNALTGYDGEGTGFGTYHIALQGAEVADIDTPHGINPSMSASWFNPKEQGHGIMIDLMDESTAWMCWFTYDVDGNAAWICGLGDIGLGTIVFENAFMVEGGNFPPFFNPSQIEEVPWGSIVITFTGCDSGRMEWMTTTEGFFTGSMPLARLTPLWGNNCN